jgi:Tfp pilus assembly protein FimT
VADPPVMKRKNNNKALSYPFFCFQRILKHTYNFHQEGFTLLQTLIVIIIIGIISAIAVPNMTVMLKSYRLKSAANELASTIQLARVTAISQNANSVLNFNAGDQSYLAFSDTGDGGGTTNDGVQSGTEPTIKTVNISNAYKNQVTLAAPSFGNTVVFSSQGTCNPNGSITLQSSGGESLQVILSTGGAVKIVKP